MAAHLSITKVKKAYSSRLDSVLALDGISLDVKPGEFVSLLGPSGCGKSTLLYIVGGFEQASSGSVTVDGVSINGPGADRGMVFQDYALFPWKTVEQNIMFGPLQQGINRSDCRDLANELISIVGLRGFGKRYPHELSGGMRQRCALARSLANDPKVLLMDEPLSAIDAMTRTMLQDQIRKLCCHGEKPKTVIYVTHAIDEAVFLSDRVVMLAPRPGRIVGVIDIPFGSQRSDDTRSLPEFQQIVAQIWQSMKAFTTI